MRHALLFLFSDDKCLASIHTDRWVIFFFLSLFLLIHLFFFFPSLSSTFLSFRQPYPQLLLVERWDGSQTVRRSGARQRHLFCCRETTALATLLDKQKQAQFSKETEKKITLNLFFFLRVKPNCHIERNYFSLPFKSLWVMLTVVNWKVFLLMLLKKQQWIKIPSLFFGIRWDSIIFSTVVALFISRKGETVREIEKRCWLA